MVIRPFPGWLLTSFAVTVLVLCSPVILALLALGAGILAKRRAVGPVKDWRPWFAWYPVRLPNADLVWLEVVERRSGGVLFETEFRGR